MRHIPLILLFVALVFALVGCIEAMKSNGATDKPLLVQNVPADFPLCEMVKPPALLDPPPGTHQYRLGGGRKDGGIS